jgi:hypothetical protein
MRKKLFYPFLFAVFPILSLFSQNVDQIRFPVTYRSFVVVLLMTSICLLILRVIIKDWHRSALICFIIIILIFTYGHIYLLIKNFRIAGLLVGRHRYMVVLWGLILLLSSWVIIKKISNPNVLAAPLNLISLGLLVLPVVTIARFEIRLSEEIRSSQDFSEEACGDLSRKVDRPSDVYYIILDAYAGHDVLWEAYDFNNSQFLESLSDMGFYVADRSQCNYNHTELSLSSSLNMNYLGEIDPIFTEGGPPDNSPLWGLLTRSLVRKNLKCLGYKIVTFDSGYYWTGWRDSDYFIGVDTENVGDVRRIRGINSFESLLIETSAGVIITSFADQLPSYVKAELEHPYQEHRNRILSTFNALGNYLPSLPGPKFVFAHLLIPHPPYIFGPNGEPAEQYGAFTLGNDQGESGEVPELIGYPNQVAFTNKIVLETIEQIISSSRVPPIIIVQGDHGIGRHSLDKVSILNAYYFPEISNQSLYPEITPVNTFRILFDEYFGGQFGLLEDITFSSPMSDKEKYNFTIIPNERISLEDYLFDQP